MTAKVFVTLKKAVLDPQGKAVQGALAKLGYPEARDVRVGRFIEITRGSGNNDTGRGTCQLP
jgi:phosphoribosylformylglycinamidine synthase subunit PurS